MSEEFALLADLHKPGVRQGPGSDAATCRAMELACLDRSGPLKIADIGCGTGAAALLLAQQLESEIIAVDFLPEFIEELEVRAKHQGLANKITPLVGSMQALPFNEDDFDVIWSEGAIYNIGFERGAREWASFLKPGGVLVASEITWTTSTRPGELQQYWDDAYPEIDTASNKIAILENCGYSPIGYFTLPQDCWLDNYYHPLQSSFDAFIQRHDNSAAARAIVTAEREEIALYTQYKGYYSYGMYVAKKTGG